MLKAAYDGSGNASSKNVLTATSASDRMPRPRGIFLWPASSQQEGRWSHRHVALQTPLLTTSLRALGRSLSFHTVSSPTPIRPVAQAAYCLCDCARLPLGQSISLVEAGPCRHQGARMAQLRLQRLRQSHACCCLPPPYPLPPPPGPPLFSTQFSTQTPSPPLPSRA